MNSLIEEAVRKFEGWEQTGGVHLITDGHARLHIFTYFRQALTDIAEAQKQSDVEVLVEMREKSYKDMGESHKLAPNSYGAGADWGAHYALDEAIKKIQG